MKLIDIINEFGLNKSFIAKELGYKNKNNFIYKLNRQNRQYLTYQEEINLLKYLIETYTYQLKIHLDAYLDSLSKSVSYNYKYLKNMNNIKSAISEINFTNVRQSNEKEKEVILNYITYSIHLESKTLPFDLKFKDSFEETKISYSKKSVSYVTYELENYDYKIILVSNYFVTKSPDIKKLRMEKTTPYIVMGDYKYLLNNDYSVADITENEILNPLFIDNINTDINLLLYYFFKDGINGIPDDIFLKFIASNKKVVEELKRKDLIKYLDSFTKESLFTIENL